MKIAHFLFLFISLSTVFLSGCVSTAQGVPVPVWATGSTDTVEDWQLQTSPLNLP